MSATRTRRVDRYRQPWRISPSSRPASAEPAAERGGAGIATNSRIATLSTNVAQSMRSTRSSPMATSSTPPAANPTVLPIACASSTIPFARPTCSFGASRTTTEFSAGIWIARSSDPTPMTTNTCHNRSTPAIDSSASARTVTALSASLTIRMVRRFQRSTSAPATGANRMPGRKFSTSVIPYWVTEPVVWNTQTASARPVNAEPSTDTSRPADSAVNLRMGDCSVRQEVVGDRPDHLALAGGVEEVPARHHVEREAAGRLVGPTAHPLRTALDVVGAGERADRQVQRRRRAEVEGVHQGEVGAQGRQQGGEQFVPAQVPVGPALAPRGRGDVRHVQRGGHRHSERAQAVGERPGHLPAHAEAVAGERPVEQRPDHLDEGLDERRHRVEGPLAEPVRAAG